MANPTWWTGSVDLENSGDSMRTPDPRFPMNESAMTGNHNGVEEEEEERENSEEPKEGAIEVVTTRRPRGRPPGSKNKPKPPVFVTRDSPNCLQCHVMEVASGADIAGSLAQFSRRRQRGVSIFSGSGAVVNVTLRQPMAASVMAFHGRFTILALNGSFLPGPSSPLGATGLTIFLAGAQGQVIGGGVVGKLVAAGPVLIIAATFTNATFERLPLEDDDQEGPGSSSPPEMDEGAAGEASPPIPIYNNNSNNNVAPNLGLLNGQQHLNHEAYNSPWTHHDHHAHHARPPY
ncbi:hypothetical protein RJT34_23265 [Clitoria ternatea]|uniref:AT-hook motif nuclear-localized protein n=1 Tax=Clitoria ternatea TaxID=43366 RepID=A0AAN9FM84_CLITE